MLIMVVLIYISVYVYLFSSFLSISFSVELFYKGMRNVIDIHSHGL